VFHKREILEGLLREENAMKNLYVGNLPHNTTETELRSIFETYGTVEKVSLVTDRETGRSRGFAFVEMANTSEADQAVVALNGSELGGRMLTINEAKPKSDSPRGGESRFNGGRGRNNYGDHARKRREPRW
jgi:cold-inducible RNA-binding protein